MTRLAYIKGEEEKALWYYSQRIKYEMDPKERARLEEVIKELKTFLKTTPTKSIDDITLTSISLSNQGHHN